MVLNRVGPQTLRLLSSETSVIHRVLDSEKFTPAQDGSWPSVTEVLGYMGYSADEFPSDQNVKQSIHLTRQIMDNFREMNRLWTYSEPSFEGVELKQPLPKISSFERLFRRSLNLKERVHLLKDPVFVHTTDLKGAERILQSGGEFADQYLSTSLFDPQKTARVYPLHVGLILKVPQDAIILAYRSAFGCPDNGDHSFVASSYQIRAVNNYVHSVLMNSKIPRCDLELTDQIQSLGAPALKHLISHYEKLECDKNEEVKRTEFKTLFRREGIGIISELQHIHDVAEKHFQQMLGTCDLRYYGGWHRAGEFQDKETLASRISSLDPDYNEVVVHTPSSCRKFGFMPPKIIGLLKIFHFPSINASVSSLAKKYQLPIFYHPSLQRNL
ncbi:MAG: hypothetical protein K2P51_08770 [Rhabdochlamydiaceae bacterium]|nr:hypothetical protein [Rhabdochlamydiaceae bacterium]